MSFDPITSIFDLGKTAIEKIWPDANKRAEEMRKLEELRQTGNLAELDAHVKILLAQIEVNKIEASSSSIFVAGPRPFVLWVGGVSLAWQFICYPMLLWIWAFLQAKQVVPTTLGPPPPLNAEILFTIVSALLGFGGMRSFDKLKGTQTDEVVKK